MSVKGSARAIVRKTIPVNARTAVARLLNRAQPAKAANPGWDHVDESDIYLVSFPRSGNTWLRNVLTNLRFPDAKWDLFALSVAFPEVGSDIDPRSAPKPRWIKSHGGPNPQYQRVIYLVRDARDVAVSFFHWSGASNQSTFDTFVREKIISPTDGSLSWQDHVLGWGLEATDSKLVVRYEDLLISGVSEIQRICGFLGLQRSDADVERALQRSSYKKQQVDFDNHPVLQGRKVGVGQGAGAWRTYFSEELHDEFWNAAGEAMTKAGYSR